MSKVIGTNVEKKLKKSIKTLDIIIDDLSRSYIGVYSATTRNANYESSFSSLSCTPAIKSAVEETQIILQSIVNNLATYENTSNNTSDNSSERKSNDEIASDVLKGKFGNGEERTKKLEEAGYDYNEIQSIVNKKLNNSSTGAKKTTSSKNVNNKKK